MQRGVDLRALTADALEIRVQALAENFVYLAIVERRVQTAGKPLGAATGAARCMTRNCAKPVLDAGRGEPNRPRKLRIEQQKFRHPLGSQVSGINAAVRLEGGTGSE